ncbi:MAG: metal-dependent phosphohydrolase [Actinomycetota bacterium]
MAGHREVLTRRWDALVARLGVDDRLAGRALAQLLTAHEGADRHYHDLRHLEECFELVDSMPDLVGADRDCVEVALWFHDVVYDTRATDNERRSAEVAAGFLGDAGRVDLVARVVEAIEMTAGHAPVSRSPVLDAVHDADLAILGAAPHRYDEYAHAIRTEYAHVGDEDFRDGRARVLRSFLAMKQIYIRSDMALHEVEARRNLEREVRALATAG